MQRRIVIIGMPGSGKTFLAKKIAAKEGIPHIEADLIYWKGGRPSPLDPFRKKVESLLKTDSWVYEGHFGKTSDLVLPRATEALVLNPSEWTAFFRMVKRETFQLLTDFSHFQRLKFNLWNWSKLRSNFLLAEGKVRERNIPALRIDLNDK